MRLIDSHVHLDGLEALDLSIERAKQVGVVAIIAVGMGGSSNRRTLEIAERYPRFVYPALGLHPRALAGLGEEEVVAELNFIRENISKVVALGEVGLDYDKRIVQTTPKPWQQDVLCRLLALAKKYDKPVVIHSLYAWKDGFDLVKQSGVSKAIFHWYTGLVNVLDSMLKAGYLISATPAAEYHEEHRSGTSRFGPHRHQGDRERPSGACGEARKAQSSGRGRKRHRRQIQHNGYPPELIQDEECAPEQSRH